MRGSCRFDEMEAQVKQPWSDISEEDLHAYLDGALDAARRFKVAAYLARFPQQAARVEAFRAQKEGMQALFDDVARETPPKRLIRIMAKRSWLRSWAPMIVGGGVAGLLLLAGSTFARQLAVLHASADPPVSAAASRSVIAPPSAPAQPARLGI
jgi:anti-sigma factor RsiW